MDEHEIVSIIIPIYNAEKYIKKCLNSVLNQTYKKLQILLVDDGSTDNSGAICDDYSKKDNRIIVIHHPNRGVSSARNIGLEKAIGEYVLFVDADDWLETNMIMRLYNKAVSNNLDIVVCEYNEFYEHEKKYERIKYKNVEKKELFCNLVLDYEKRISGFLFTKLLKRDLIIKNFRENIDMKEDMVFLLENFSNITNYAILDEALYNYRITDTSVSHTKAITDKKITSIEAEKFIIENINCKYTESRKLAFLDQYYYYTARLKGEKLKLLKQKYSKYMKQYQKEIIKSNNINMENKVKIILKDKFNFIYNIFEKIKK